MNITCAPPLPKVWVISTNYPHLSGWCLQMTSPLCWLLLPYKFCVHNSYLRTIIITVLYPIETLSFEPPPLPEGWVIIRHQSGADVYLHKQSRTCTWSRPYTAPANKTIKVLLCWMIRYIQRCGNIEPTTEHFELFSSLLSCFRYTV